MKSNKLYISLFLTVILLASTTTAQEDVTTQPSSPTTSKQVNSTGSPVVTAGVEYNEDDNISNKTQESKSPSETTEVPDEVSEDEDDDNESTEPPMTRCFNSIEGWQRNLLRRIIVTEDNVKYLLASMIGKTSRRDLLRRGLHNLMILERVVQAAGTPLADTTEDQLDNVEETTTEVETSTVLSRDEEAMQQTLLRSERNLNRIGWVIYRGKNGWQFQDCCFKDINTMCGQHVVKAPA